MNIYCGTKIWLNRWLRSRCIVKKDLEIVENLTFSLTAYESLDRFNSKTNQHLHFIRSCYPPKIIEIRSFVFLLCFRQTLFFSHIFIHSYTHTHIHTSTHTHTRPPSKFCFFRHQGTSKRVKISKTENLKFVLKTMLYSPCGR